MGRGRENWRRPFLIRQLGPAAMINSCMKTITIPASIGRDQRDILVQRATREISLALRRLEKLSNGSASATQPRDQR